MCFSATASLSAAALLAALGTGAVIACPARRMLPYAAIPLLFSLQQLVEGVLWLALQHGIPSLAGSMSQAFNVFAHVLWPVYVPLAVFLIEPQSWRKSLLAWLAVAGTGLGAYYLSRMVLVPFDAFPSDGHIQYHVVRYFANTGMSLYAAATAGALLASSWRWVRLFGALVLLAFMLTWWIYARWLVSVWCFFAALLSTIVLAQVLAAHRRAAPPPP